ncbi:MAG: amidohydrolase family protein [Armatimonadia bacterium]
MLTDPLAQSLLDQIAALPTVDAHEHLHAEEMRVGRQVDIFLLFHQYLFTQLIAAGMDPAMAEALGDEETPLDRKWEALAPYLDLVRTCSCARPPFEALKQFFDEEDLTKDNYQSLTERMRAHNQPGLFDRCLQDACGIVKVLNQNRTMWQTDVFRPILFETSFIGGPGREGYEAVAREMGRDLPRTLPEYEELMEALLAQRASEGMVGVKSIGFEYVPGDRGAAMAAYRYMQAGTLEPADAAALNHYLRDRLWAACGRLGLVASIHTGVWSGGWADHTNIRPTNIFPAACAHRETKFDLFHAGTPWPADAGLIGRGLPNVWLNLCWSHLISPVQAAEALDLWLDMVPVNRVFAFGGDYWWAVENVYGSLTQTREIVAKVLAKRVKEGAIRDSQCLPIARKWLHDNPREVYGI